MDFVPKWALVLSIRRLTATRLSPFVPRYRCKAKEVSGILCTDQNLGTFEVYLLILLEDIFQAQSLS